MSNYNQKKILSQFPVELQSHIIEFCKLLSSKKADVFILFARKAACFISVLEKIGLLQLDGMVTSERVLDYDTDWLTGKSVVLIDDTIFSGTSLFKIIQTLEKIHVEKISIYAFAVNQFWFEEEMLLGANGKTYLKHPYLILNHSACLQFCKDIVDAFAIFPRPYSTDFPLFENIRFSESEFIHLQNLENWDIVNTTSSRQLNSGISTFSMNPDANTVKAFFEILGCDLSQFCYIKLRVYNEKFVKNKEIYYIARIIPFIIFETLTTEQLKIIIIGICQSEGIAFDSFARLFKTDSGKLRFIQYYIAKRFFNYARTFIKKRINKVSNRDNLREIDLLFHPEIVHTILKFKYQTLLNVELHTSKKNEIFYNSIKSKLINPLIVKDVLYKKFIDLYYTKELLARRAVKLSKRKVFQNEDNQQTLNRLNSGFTFRDLTDSIAPQIEDAHDRALFVSNFLDNSIDSGIIVPVTLDLQGSVARGYRHGEEIIWAENNDKFLSIFFKSFLDTAREKSFTRTWFQKLLVLFLKMGLKKELLEEYKDSTPPPKATTLIAVRTFLHGEITVKYELLPKKTTNFNPVIDPELKIQWTSQKLQEQGYLTIDNDGIYKLDTDALFDAKDLTDPQEPKDITSKHVNIAEEMGELLAIAKQKKVLNIDGLVVLTSCISIKDCIASIAAEVQFFHIKIKQICQWVLSAKSRNSFSIKFLNGLRDKKENVTWFAVNNGIDKFLNFKRGEAGKLVKKISESFENRFQKRAWDDYWNLDIAQEFSTSPDLFNLNDEIGLFLINQNVYLTYLQSLIFAILRRNGEIDIYLKQQSDLIIKLNYQIDEYKDKLAKLLIKTSGSKQATLNFEKSPQINFLEEQKRRYTKEKKQAENEFDQWSRYSLENINRIKDFTQQYTKVNLGDFESNNQILSIVTDEFVNYSDEQLQTKIASTVALLMDQREKAVLLLNSFAAILPHWGKINSTVIYSSVIHVSTLEQDKTKKERFRDLVNKVVTIFQCDEFNDEESATRSVVLFQPTSYSRNNDHFIGGKGARITLRMSRLAAKLLVELKQSHINFQIILYSSLGHRPLVGFYNEGSTFYDKIDDDNFYKTFIAKKSKFKNHQDSILLCYDPQSNQAKSFKLQITNVNENICFEELATVDDFSCLKFTLDEKSKKTLEVIGIVTAKEIEFTSMKSMLDEPRFDTKENDLNIYVLGNILNRNNEFVKVVLAMTTVIGTNNAASTATQMLNSYPEVSNIIMVGIAGGAPNPTRVQDHVRLGDIVVSDSILQYDSLRIEKESIKIKDSSPKPSSKLLRLCRILNAEMHSLKYPWLSDIEKISAQIKHGARPHPSTDILNIRGVQVEHPYDPDRVDDTPRIHMGRIASSNTLLKNEEVRDYLRDNYQVKAFEMEGSGIGDGTWTLSKNYLIIRGIVDYCNDDKNDAWHPYASIAAAAYTKCVIELMLS